MTTLLLVQPTAERNGVLVKKTSNNINSCELRKVSISGRDNGYISSINLSGTIIPTGLSWRGSVVKSPIDMKELSELVSKNFDEIKKIINQ